MKRIILIILFIPFLLFAQNADFSKVPGVVVAHSPKTSGKYLGSPSITIMPNGHYIVSLDIFGPGQENENIVHLYKSTDKGKNWKFVTEIEGAHWSGLFNVREKLYLLGTDVARGNLVIRVSENEGKDWSKQLIIKEAPCHGSSTPVVFSSGRIYKGYDMLGNDDIGTFTWMSKNSSYILSADVRSDLLHKENWLITNMLMKPDTMEGSGWLETNAVRVGERKIAGIMRLNTIAGYKAGYYELLNDSTIDLKSVRTINFPGGSTKFNIGYDKKSDKYWSLANVPDESLRTAEMRAGGMRSVLALTSSENLYDWKVEKVILQTQNIKKEGFQYVDWKFEHNDIVFVSRTAFDDGIGGADNFHNSNFITFHRIKDFRK